MTRLELINRFSELDVFCTKTAAGETLDALLGIIIEEVSQGNEVALGQYFGKFVAATQAARTGSMNGVLYDTPAKQVIKFKPSSVLKATIAE